MKPYLYFLGSGASVPFGLPTMSEMVKQFEETLQNNTPVKKEYDFAKLILRGAYEYVDIESIFSVVDMIARDIPYVDLGLTSAYILTLISIGIDLKEKAFTPRQVETAKQLTKEMKHFVRNRCQIEDSAEVDERINKIYGKLFEAICGKYSIEKLYYRENPPFMILNVPYLLQTTIW